MFLVKRLLFIAILFSGYSAMAFPKHLFWCGLLSTEPMRQIYFEIEESDVNTTGVGTLMISQLSRNAPVNTGWKVIETASVKPNIIWTKMNGVPFISALKIDMGRTGQLTAIINGSINNFSGQGYVIANLMNLNFPAGKDFDYCTYFHATNPKPGMTGSN
jgi:hypothetical protein